ncbi:MAG: arylamine N-acetyltransferase [Polyangiaceae bacterium]|nr:arylamine N-acetyltransferase [Polyangiaceae bacterium]
MTYRPDLAAYLARIGYAGPTPPTVDTLHALSHAHVSTIPFENADVLLDRGIDLDPAAVEAKLVGAGRGGYCFEHNSLLLQVLTALGFAARPISARVRIGRARDFTPARTHVFVRVDLDDGPWLCDVGVGAWSLTSAIRLQLDEPQPTPHEPRRIIAEGAWDGFTRRSPDARLFHQVRLGDEWADVNEFTLEEMPEIDRVVGNWYTSTHPRSHFRDRLIVARATTSGRLTLVDRTLTRRTHDGATVVETLQSYDALLAALAREFGLTFPAGTRFGSPGLADLA